MRLVGTREASRMVQVAPRTLIGWIQRGRVVAFRDAVNGRLYLPTEEVERLRPERRLQRVSTPRGSGSQGGGSTMHG